MLSLGLHVEMTDIAKYAKQKVGQVEGGTYKQHGFTSKGE